MTAIRLSTALLAAIACVTLIACGGDDGGTNTTPTATERETPAGVDSPTPGDDKPTPTDEQSPQETVEPGGDTPTPPPPANEGIKATLVDDQSAYLLQFQGRNLQEEDCLFSPVTRITDCAGVKYAIDPPIVGQDIACFRGVVDGQPEYIRCQSVEPEQSIVYEIQG